MKTKDPKTLKALFFRRFMLTFALPLFIIGGIALAVTLPQERKKVINYNAILAKNISKIISVDMTGGEEFLRGVSTIHSDQDTLYRDYIREISRSSDFSSLLANVYTLDSMGKVTWFYPFSSTESYRSFSYSGVTYRYKEFFKLAAEQNRSVWSETYTSLITGNRTVTILLPHKKGFFAADINMQHLIQNISTLHINDDMQFTILDRFGNYIYHPSEKHLYKYSKIPLLSHNKRESQTFLFSEENRTLLGTASQIEESGWTVIVSQDYLNVMKAVLFWATTLLILFITMFFFALRSSLSSSHKMSDLLIKTGERAASIGEGTYNFPAVSVDIREFETLNRSVDSMGQAVRIREEEITKAQLKAEEQFKFQQRLIDSISNPVFVVQNGEKILLANRSCKESIGDNPELLMELLAKKEATLILKDGKEHSVVIQHSHFAQSENSLDVVSITDITDRLDLENRLHHSEKLQSIGQLAGGIAHDVNNQLTGILGYAELIKTVIPSDAHFLPYIEGIIEAVNQSSAITHQLLAFARQGKYSLKPISLNELAESAAGILRHTISRKIILSVDTNGFDPVIMADKSQVQNAVLNLGINARDAIGDEQGEIVIKVYSKVLTEPLRNFNSEIPEGSYGVICVCDTGYGINESDITRIFEPFFTTKPEGKGTGMGLAAVYGTVTTHEGFIQVESVLGEGSCFNLFFPLSEEKRTPIEDSSEKSEETVHGESQDTILLIDDDQAIRLSTAELLQIKGFTCYTAENGAIGIETFKQHIHEIDLVLLDANMPVMNGYETFQELRLLSPDIWIIMITGYADENSVRELMKTKHCDYLHKPFKINPLLEKITICLNNKRSS